MTSKSSKGFSLIELLVVVAIVGILAAIGTVSYQGYVKSSKRTAAQNIVQQTALAQTEEYSNSGSYVVTTSLGDGGSISTAVCEANNASSDAVEEGLFNGDDVISNQIGLNENFPYVEVEELKKNKSFIAKKAKTHEEEKQLGVKAPIEKVKITCK